MNLAAIFKRYLSGRETGQLVVKFADVENLCKISIENGSAVYIALGNMTPQETLGYISGKMAVQANFIPGVSPRKKLDSPLNDALLGLAGSHAAMPSGPAAVRSGGGTIPAQTVDGVVEAFIDIVGPLGTVIARNILSRLGYAKGSPIDGENYSVFIMALTDEIPDEQKKDFLSRHQK